MSSALENETTGTANKVEHFGRSWTLPSKLGLQEERRLNAIMAAQFVHNEAAAIAEAYLSSEDFEALLEINPTRPEQSDFANAIVAAMGFDSAGNS